MFRAFLVSLLLVATAVSAEPIQTKIKVNDFKGYTYLAFMRNVVKPNMDRLVREGYTMCGATQVKKVLKNVDTKVQRQVKQAGKTVANVLKIAEALKGTKVNLDSLPNEIAKIDRSVNRYKLSTFFGLACGGGITVVYNRYNYGLNVHYDVKEQRSGRSFGVGPGRKANDASDKKYLDDLEKYLAHDAKNNHQFYVNLFKVLLTSDTKTYYKVAKDGQSVLTDFLSVFTAEQARNLMDGKVSPHWDAALLEVTMLGNFHAGQDKFKIMYFNPQTKKTSFTTTTLAQKPCAVPDKATAAHMRDYWQFSRQYTNTQHCRRSGINITKREFRGTGALITRYVAQNNPSLYKAVIASLGVKSSKNVFSTLSYFLINDKLPESLGSRKASQMTKAWVSFLDYINVNAPEITTWIDAGMKRR
ncbi:hypothetical protein N9D31_03975 [Oligoflexaceae bacterium]|nr:hypothetical protein [Oligoflexaceae bacterium]